MIGMAGLLRIDFPTGTVRLCEGGIVRWGSDAFRGRHATFGVVGAIEGLEEGVGAMVPAMQLTLLPSDAATPGDLSQPGFQKSPVWLWLAEYDPATSQVIGTPQLQFLGQVDQTVLTLKKELRITVVSQAERLFSLNRGNPLSPVMHKRLFPGETGEDQATGLGVSVAWGVESPSTSGGGAFTSARTPAWVGGGANTQQTDPRTAAWASMR